MLPLLGDEKSATAVLDPVLEPMFTDPLSEVTRAERKTLLFLSLVSAAIAVGGLVPREIPALGIELTSGETLTLLYLLAAALTYYLVGFLSYVSNDLRRRGAIITKASAEAAAVLDRTVQQLKKGAERRKEGEQFDLHALIPHLEIASHARSFARAKGTAAMRLFFDAVLPVPIAALSLGAVLWESSRLSGSRAPFWLVMVVFALLACSWGIRARRQLVGQLARARHAMAVRRHNKLFERIKALDPGDPQRQVLVTEWVDEFKGLAKGPWL